MKYYIDKSNEVIDSNFAVILILVLSSFMINVPLPLTNSGILALYGSDFISVILLFMLVFDIFYNFNEFPKIAKRVIMLSLIFIGVTIVFTGIRFISGNRELKSLLIPRVFIFSIPVYIMVLKGTISVKSVINGLRYFITGLAFISLFLFFYSSPMAYKVLQGPAIRTSVQMFAYPVVIYSLYKDYGVSFKKKYLVMIVISTMGLFVSGISSGSRINSIMIPTEIIMLFIIGIRNNKVFWKLVVLGVTLGVVFLVSVYPISYRYRIGSSRSALFKPIESAIIYPLYKDSTFIDMFGEPRYTHNVGGDGSSFEDMNDALNEATSQSKVDSSNSRFGVWKLAINDILENPIIGPGLKYYPVEYSTGTKHIIPPHNFLLEYALGYGIIGLILFISILLYPLYVLTEGLLNKRKDILNYTIIVLLTGGAIAVNVLFQPLFLNPPITLIILTVLSTLTMYGMEYEVCKTKDIK